MGKEGGTGCGWWQQYGEKVVRSLVYSKGKPTVFFDGSEGGLSEREMSRMIPEWLEVMEGCSYSFLRREREQKEQALEERMN